MEPDEKRGVGVVILGGKVPGEEVVVRGCVDCVETGIRSVVANPSHLGSSPEFSEREVERESVCVCACVRACVRECVRACIQRPQF